MDLLSEIATNDLIGVSDCDQIRICWQRIHQPDLMWGIIPKLLYFRLVSYGWWWWWWWWVRLWSTRNWIVQNTINPMTGTEMSTRKTPGHHQQLEVLRVCVPVIDGDLKPWENYGKTIEYIESWHFIITGITVPSNFNHVHMCTIFLAFWERETQQFRTGGSSYFRAVTHCLRRWLKGKQLEDMTPWYAGEFTVVSSDTNFSMEYPHKIWPEKWYVYVPPSVGSWRSPIELSPTFSDSADSHQVAAIDCHPFERLGGMACSSWVPGFCGRIVKSKEEGKFEATFKTTWKKRDFGVKTMEVAKRKVAKYRYFIELLSVVFSCYQFFTRHSVVSLSFPQFFSGCWSVLRDLGARWPESSPIWGTTKRRLPSCPWSDGRRRKSTRDGRDGLITGVKLWSKIHPNFNQFFFGVY